MLTVGQTDVVNPTIYASLLLIKTPQTTLTYGKCVSYLALAIDQTFVNSCGAQDILLSLVLLGQRLISLVLKERVLRKVLETSLIFGQYANKV